MGEKRKGFLSKLTSGLGKMIYDSSSDTADKPNDGSTLQEEKKLEVVSQKLPVIASVPLSGVSAPVDMQKLDIIIQEIRKSGVLFTDFLKSVRDMLEIVPNEQQAFRAVAKVRGIANDALLRAAQEQQGALQGIKDNFGVMMQNEEKKVEKLTQEMDGVSEEIQKLLNKIEELKIARDERDRIGRQIINDIQISEANFYVVYSAAEGQLRDEMEKIKNYLGGIEKKEEING